MSHKRLGDAWLRQSVLSQWWGVLGQLQAFYKNVKCRLQSMMWFLVLLCPLRLAEESPSEKPPQRETPLAREKPPGCRHDIRGMVNPAKKARDWRSHVRVNT